MRSGNNGNNNNNNNNNKNNNNNTSASDNNNMEPSFYEDNNNAQFAAVVINNNMMKRPLTLDLNAAKGTGGKKQRLNQTLPTTTGVTPAPLVLESPDLQALKLSTPDLEKFLLSSNLPTPSLVFPTKVTVTTEQEDYAKGFVDALNSLRNSENSQNAIMTTTATSVVATNGMSGGSITYTNLDETFPVAIKDEPQTVPNSPPLSPIDMETQEKIKLERKRQRNRVAASKCRKRKLERISKLEDKVKILKGENTDLASVIKQLKEHVFQLKQQVIDHIQAGCNIPLYNGAAVLQAK